MWWIILIILLVIIVAICTYTNKSDSNSSKLEHNQCETPKDEPPFDPTGREQDPDKYDSDINSSYNIFH